MKEMKNWQKNSRNDTGKGFIIRNSMNYHKNEEFKKEIVVYIPRIWYNKTNI